MSAVAAASFRHNVKSGGLLPRYSLIGILIGALVPAGFWTVALALAGFVWGAPFDFTTLGAVAVAIALFLTVIAGAVVVSEHSSDE